MYSIIYISDCEDGHRNEYDQLLTSELAQVGIRLDKKLSPSQPRDGNLLMFYSMMDGFIADFSIRAMLRSLLGRKTAGLFFRPAECFKPSLKYRFKYLLFRCVSRLPGVRVITILPFPLAPRFAEVATDWIYDPQLWDLSFFGLPPEDGFAALDEEIRIAARGRRVLMTLGGQNREKGFDYFADIWSASDALRESFLFVAAGKVAAESAPKAERFAGQGGLLLNRRIEDGEFLHLYRRADAIWSCYAPDYNQASGIFGRAVQLGVPVLVREGSYLEQMQPMLAHPTLAVPFDQPEAAARGLLAWQPHPSDPQTRAALVRQMREHSLSVLTKALA